MAVYFEQKVGHCDLHYVITLYFLLFVCQKKFGSSASLLDRPPDPNLLIRLSQRFFAGLSPPSLKLGIGHVVEDKSDQAKFW